jgi:phosphoribosylglycinamide formyltransferase-1
MEKLRLGLLGSGKGSNYRAIQEAILRGEVPAETAVVISDVETAGILDAARQYGVRAEYVAPGRFRTKMEPESEQRIADLLKEARVDLVVLAGYMRMVKAPLLDAFPGRIINIHPSLLPAFPGLEAWRQALAASVPETGCTVHWVDSGMDTGPIIAQRKVPILPGDTPESLHARIQIAEHEVYPEVVSKLAKKLSTKI